jgi:hypothetical protein
VISMLLVSFGLHISVCRHWVCVASCYFRRVPNLEMSFRSMVRDLRESFGNIPRRNFEVRIHHRGKSLGSSSDLQDRHVVIQQSRWASLPPELLRDVMKRLEEDESSWPSRKDVVSCASVCTTWRDMCKDIVTSPEICAKLTFPVSLKQVMRSFSISECTMPFMRFSRLA